MLDASAEPLVRALGFDALDAVAFANGAATGVLRSRRTVVGLVVAHWGERLDPLWRIGVVQTRSRGGAWCLAFNGAHMRLINADRVLSRRFAEFDLDIAADDERTAAAMWTLLSAESLSAADEGTAARIYVIVTQSERHASAVCRSLRDGVLEASTHTLRALAHGLDTRLLDVAFEQSLTVVYRVLFLFFAEARALVPLWHPVYRNSYSLEVLRDAAVRGSSVGLWDALRAVTRLAHAGCRAGDLRVTPFNGRLFAPARTPLAERRNLNDDQARHLLVALSTRPSPDREGRERIAYGELGVEQLGTIYETLLDYTPVVESANTTRRTSADDVSLKSGSGARKDTGTFYTPQPITSYLIRRTLGPLVRDASADRILALRVLDPSMGSGAFLVAACGYLADAYEAALVRDGDCRPGDFGPHERALVRRTVAERCLYGVDLNPMAVQLACLSLWLTALTGDRPLSFLDHHLLVGDSLLGVWLSCLRRIPADRRRPAACLPLFSDAPVADAVRGALPIRFSLASEPNDTPAQVRAKEIALRSLADPGTALSRWKRVADLWCARWFSSDGNRVKALFPTLCDAILTKHSALPIEKVAPVLERAERLATTQRFFHWELEFPEVFFDASGARRPDAGFDAVVGNPPWDMVRADTAGRRSAAPGAASVVRFSRSAGVYSAQSDGQANRYQLFLERSIALTRPGGRVGLVLPFGLASDHGSASLRRLLFDQCDVDGLVGFDNRLAIFPIHRSTRFLLLTASCGSATRAVACRFGEVDPSALEHSEVASDAADPWFPIRLTPSLLRRLSGDDMAIPDLRSPMDLAIAERAAALFPPLGQDSGWGVRFGRELNATEDRGRFSSSGRGLPVVEGKLMEPFRVRLDAARWSLAQRDANQLLGGRHERARLAYRDVASATNRVTLIAAILPAGCVSTHTVFCLKSLLPLRAQHFLCGMFNSLVVNYLVRMRVTTHVTTSIVQRLPIPDESLAGRAFREIAAMARLLRVRDDRNLRAHLNARVAMLYALSEDEFVHVLDTFPLVPGAERAAALKQFKQGGSLYIRPPNRY